jgi:hypothetical protein
VHLTGGFRGSRFVVVVLAIAAVACTPKWELPDRSDPAVKREEQRVAGELERSDVVLWEPGGRCDVRLLGKETTTSYVWAHCELPSGAATSLPARVRPDGIDTPEDGSGFGPSVRELFPPGLAELILNDPDRLRP